MAGMMRPNDLCTAAYYGDVKKLKELLTLPAVEEEPPIDPEFDPLAPPDEEAEAAAADRAEARKQNALELKKRLSSANCIVTRLSPVNTQHFGFGVKVREEGESLKLKTAFKPSKKSSFSATPLHWAVLGREHEAVEYLILQGADVDQVVPQLNVTVFDICAANSLLETERRIKEALEAYKTKAVAERKKWDDRAAVLAGRKQKREQALAEQRRKEEEERLEAEREASAAEAAANPPQNEPEEEA